MGRYAVITLIVAMLALSTHSAGADVDVTRSGAENPAVEVFRSTIYGAGAGLCVGLAIVALSDGHASGEILRNSFAIGTFAGLGMGLYFVMSRPQPTALLQIQDGETQITFAPPEAGIDGDVRVRLIGVRF